MTAKRTPMALATTQRLQRAAAKPHADPVTATLSASRSKRKTADADTETKLPPSRQGKVPLAAWVLEDNRAALKLYAAKHRTTVDELLTAALEQFFKSCGIRFKR